MIKTRWITNYGDGHWLTITGGESGGSMANEKCCYDCVFCIQSNAPIEAGLQYVCADPKSVYYKIDPCGEPCECFVGGVLDGK